MASTFAKAFAAGRGSAAKAGAKAGGPSGAGRGTAPKAAPAPPRAEAEEQGTVTCANRGLLQQMLSGVLQEPSDGEFQEEDPEPDPLGMSLRTVHPQPQGGRNVPTISSPPINGRPGSRGGPGAASGRRVSIGTLESHVRPASREGPIGSQQRSAPSTARVQKVQTGAPRPAITNYVSGPRPGSRGAGGGTVPPAGGEVSLSPGGWQKPVVRPAVQPKGGKAAAAGYAGLHQAKAKPPSPGSLTKVAPAAKPRCGPAAFQLIKKVESQAQQAEFEEEDEGDGGFAVPESDEDIRADPQGGGGGFVMPDDDKAPLQEDAAAAYVAQLKKSMGLQAATSQAAPYRGGEVPSTTSQARARSSDTRATAAPDSSGVAPVWSLPRSRSSDPRAHIAAARAMTGHESEEEEEEEDEEDEPTAQGFQWKAGIRGLVKQFAQEERARMASPPTKPMSPTSSRPEDEPVTRRPPRAPGPPVPPPPERQRASAGPASTKVEEEVAPSKKPRIPVEYTPATVEDYKQRFGSNAAELGRLGPDLDDEGLLMKRAIQEKVKQFSKELHRVNKQRAERTVPPKQPQLKPDPKPTARAKAREFAKNIPKPKLAPPKQILVTPNKTEEEIVQENHDWEEIRRRERQHFEDAAKVAQVKDFLERLAV